MYFVFPAAVMVAGFFTNKEKENYMQPIEEMIDELRDETKKKIATMKEPRYAYVMVEVPKNIYRMDNVDGKQFKQHPGFGVGIINLEHQPGQMWKIKRELEHNGNKLIAFGNFPTATDTNPTRQRLYNAHRGENGQTPWDDIRDYLEAHVRGKKHNVRQLKLAEEVERQRKEIEQLRGAKNGNTGRATATAV